MRHTSVSIRRINQQRILCLAHRIQSFPEKLIMCRFWGNWGRPCQRLKITPNLKTPSTCYSACLSVEGREQRRWFWQNPLAKASTAQFSLSPWRLKALRPVTSSRAKILTMCKLKTCQVWLQFYKSKTQPKTWSLSAQSCVKRSSCMNIHLVARKSCSDADMTFWKEANISRLNLN